MWTNRTNKSNWICHFSEVFICSYETRKYSHAHIYKHPFHRTWWNLYTRWKLMHTSNVKRQAPKNSIALCRKCWLFVNAIFFLGKFVYRMVPVFMCINVVILEVRIPWQHKNFWLPTHILSNYIMLQYCSRTHKILR